MTYDDLLLIEQAASEVERRAHEHKQHGSTHSHAVLFRCAANLRELAHRVRAELRREADDGR